MSVEEKPKTDPHSVDRCFNVEIKFVGPRQEWHPDHDTIALVEAFTEDYAHMVFGLINLAKDDRERFTFADVSRLCFRYGSDGKLLPPDDLPSPERDRTMAFQTICMLEDTELKFEAMRLEDMNFDEFEHWLRELQN